MILEVLNIEDNDDGSATLTVDMDQETLKKFASIGIIKVLKDNAEDIINNVDQFIEDVKDNPPKPMHDVAAAYIDDAIKVLESRMTEFPISYDEKLIIDTLSDTCHDALQILIVARSFFDNKT
jgi:hypothetical protein